MSAVTSEDQLIRTIEELRAQVLQLSARLDHLELAGKPAQAPVSAAESAAPVQAEEPEISPEILLVISAAVAAFLGERGHIKAVRLVSTNRWAQQGRVNIQASHSLSRT